MRQASFADLGADRLREIVGRFPLARIAVVGDYFLDRYLTIDPELTEPSLETGLGAWQVVEKRPQPGAAGTVTGNLTALGVGDIRALGFMGDDGEGYEMRQGLGRSYVDTRYLLIRPEIMTPTYCKPLVREADGSLRELNRLDSRNREPTSDELQDAVIEALRLLTLDVRTLIIADQEDLPDRGVITPRVVDELARLAEEHPDRIMLADSRGDISRFRNLMVKPNASEACRAAGIDCAGEPTLDQAAAAGEALHERNQRPVFVTVGAQGMVLFDEDGATHLPAVPVDGPVDIVGAGDSTTAGIVAALCAGATRVEAGLIGNLVASITVQQLGTTGTASPAQVIARHAQVS